MTVTFEAAIARARELRDRYLEQLNTHDIAGCGKYDVSRRLPSPAEMSVAVSKVPLLDAA